MVRQTTKVIILEILAGLGLLVIIAVVALAVRLSAGPIKLDFFKDDIEATLSASRDGRQMTLDDISLEWLKDERRAVITAANLRFYDEQNILSAEAGNAEIILDTSELFLGKVRPVGLVLESGWIGVHQGLKGWSVAGDPYGGQQASGDVRTEAQEGLRAEALIDATNKALIDVLDVLRRDAADLPLEQLRFSDIDLVLSAESLGERARLTGAQGGFSRDASGIMLNVSAQNFARGDAPAGFAAQLTAPGDYSQISAAVAFQEWSLESVANIFPALAGTITDLPSNLTISAFASQQAGLEQVTFDAKAGAGRIAYGDLTQNVGKVTLSGVYLPASDKLDVTLNDFDIGPGQGDISLTIENLFKAEAARQFALESSSLALDFTEHFSEPWQLDRLKATGQIAMETRAIVLDTASIGFDDAVLRLRGDIELLENVEGRDLPIAADLTAELTGTLLASQFVRYWPLKLAPQVRAALMRIVEAGMITGATAQIKLERNTLAQGYLDDNALDVEFAVAIGRLRVLPDIPAYENVNATGHMTGTTLKLAFSGGVIGDWTIGEGTLYYPQLAPKGGNMMLDIAGRGPAQSLLQIISDSRLQLQARTGLDPANITGQADMAFSMVRPLRPKVPLSEYKYSGEGSVRAGGFDNVFNGLSLTGSDAKIALSDEGIEISGFGDISTSPIQYDWSFEFGQEGAPAALRATSILNPDILNDFGIAGRAYLTGDVPVELEALLDGQKLRFLDAAFDLLGARLDVAEFNWVKPQGEPATASVRYNVTDNTPTTTARLDAEGAAFDGTFTLEENGRLVSANIERAYLKDQADFTGTAQRTDTAGLLFKLAGSYIDLSRLVPEMSALGGRGTNETARFGDIMVEAEVEKLLLRPGLSTTQTSLSIVSNGGGLQTMEAEGLLPNGADFDLAYDASGLGDPSFLINSGDASFLASVFFDTDALEGGTLEMSGTLATGDLPTQVRLVIENGRLKEAPFVTQILSLASFRGLSDTLSGDGVLFTKAELPLTIVDGRYNIVGARASGPALGLTANGWIAPASGEIDIDGVLVPSFGLNSALGGIPVIGDLFISRQGEGVISLRYGIEGTLEKAQVSVNPLSAITPGVLRRIFENPASEDLPPIKPQDENTEGGASEVPPETIPGE